MKADLIAYACYEIRYPAARKAALEAYNSLESVPVEKKSKRKVKTVELKEFVPSLDLTEEGEQVRFSICLPASQELTLNPALLTAALEETFGVPAAEASILRTHFLTAEKTLFA